MIAATVALPWQRPPARRLERPAGSPPQRPCLKQHPDARLCTGQLVCRAGGRQFYGRRESEPIRYGRQRAATGSFAGELRPEPSDVHQSVNVHPLTIARSTAWLEPRAALSTGRRGGFSGSERRRARSVRHTSTAHGRGGTGLGPASPDRARARPRSRPSAGGERHRRAGRRSGPVAADSVSAESQRFLRSWSGSNGHGASRAIRRPAWPGHRLDRWSAVPSGPPRAAVAVSQAILPAGRLWHPVLCWGGQSDGSGAR